jgi:hypothetical protein
MRELTVNEEDLMKLRVTELIEESKARHIKLPKSRKSKKFYIDAILQHLSNSPDPKTDKNSNVASDSQELDRKSISSENVLGSESLLPDKDSEGEKQVLGDNRHHDISSCAVYSESGDNSLKNYNLSSSVLSFCSAEFKPISEASSKIGGKEKEECLESSEKRTKGVEKSALPPDHKRGKIVETMEERELPDGLEDYSTENNVGNFNYVHIENFKRPLRLPDLKLFLSSFGKYDPSSFWIDDRKSHCIVKYEEVASAANAQMTIDGKRWPSEEREPLRASFLEEGDVEEKKTRFELNGKPAAS